jgi:hypothetical protein
MKANTRYARGKPLVDRFKEENDVHPKLYVSWGGRTAPGYVLVRLGGSKVSGESIPYRDAVFLNQVLHHVLPPKGK